MSKVGEKVAYLKGLAEGLGVNGETEQGKLMLAMIDTLEALAKNDEDEEDDDEAYEDEDDDEDGDGLIEYECPHCGTVIFFDENAFDMEEEHLCPNCHRKVFEDDGEDGDDEE